MRWAKQFGMDEAIGLVYIPYITTGAHVELNMIVRMVTYAVATTLDFFEEFGMFSHVISHHKEGGFDAVMIERIENPRSGFGYGTIVESEIDGALVGIHTPNGAGIKPSKPFAGLFYNHSVLLCCKCKIEVIRGDVGRKQTLFFLTNMGFRYRRLLGMSYGGRSLI